MSYFFEINKPKSRDKVLDTTHKLEYHGINILADTLNVGVPILPSQKFDDTNDLSLQDISQRDKPWDNHRANADKAANHYREDVDFSKYAVRIDFCSQLLDFKLLPEESEYKLKLHTARFCRVRYCPVCQWRRSLMWKAKAFKILPIVVEAYPKHRWLFLTLTVRNCQITELRDTLQWLNKSWQRMSQRKKFPAIGWIRFTEVTQDKDGFAHPHFHCLLLVKPSYFGKYYMNQKKWVEFWRSCLRIDYQPIVHVASLQEHENPAKLVPEILKYCVKESDLVANQEWFLELTRQMHKMRTVATGGVLKEYLKTLEEEPEDLIGKDETKTEDEVDEGHLLFNWRYDEKKYRLKS